MSEVKEFDSGKAIIKYQDDKGNGTDSEDASQVDC